MDTTIIIITFENEKTIISCLSSISPIHPLIIVDNASTDSTVTLIKKIRPRTTIIQNNRNLGFAKACNQGAKIANKEYLFFLNPDTVILNNDPFNKLQEFVRGKENLGVVGFKFLNPDGSLQPSCGQFPTILRVIFDRIKLLNLKNGLLIRDRKLYEKTRVTDWASASGVLVRKDVFEKVGGFNEDIFMYGEDFDLCFRLKQMGYKNYFFPGVRIVHNDSGKNNPLRKPHKYFSMRRGLLLFLKNHQPTLNYLILQLLVKLESLVFLLLLPFRKHKNLKEKDLWRKYLLKSLYIKV